MTDPRIVIRQAGLVTSVGLSAPAAAAAIRAGIANHTPTTFFDADGEWIRGGQVPFAETSTGRARVTTMLAMAIDECCAAGPPLDERHVPVLVCLAEADRPGRVERLDRSVIDELEAMRGYGFDAKGSGIVAHGRVGVGIALAHARKLLLEGHAPAVLIAAADSLIVGPTLLAYEREDRLLTPRNSNGFVPGEAAGAVLVTRDDGDGARLVCRGIGFAQEPATINSGQPLRGDGLVQAINNALADADCALHDLDFRVTDNSGEQYYFREAALALTRTLRQRKEEFDIWHPAECTGEVGAASGVIALTVALIANQKGYSPGAMALFHASNDGGQRYAAVFGYQE